MAAGSVDLHPWAWLTILALGAYHGLNPGMGWLLAVSSGMQAKRTSAVFLALPPIALGHFLAMGAALLPFALLGVYLERISGIRAAAGVLLIAFGLCKLLSQRHPRFLARIGPSHLVLWSFMMATAHGAGLMLVPVVLGLCAEAGSTHGGHFAVQTLAAGDIGLSLVASAAHTLTMVLAGGALAWLVYRYAALGLLRRAWINLDLLWALLLLAMGLLALGAVFWQ